MKRIQSTKLFYILFLFVGFGIGTNVYSQTVVQWYTSMGDFKAQLREDLVPVTAGNFIDLTNANFYDDLIFHRVIAGFMNQDGCPNGTGTGGPGYTFDDEFHPDLRHDEPGILSMANSGPNTNGSQYFITVAPTDWLDDAHAVFGKIIDGMEVVYAISEVETNSNDKPLIDIEIDSIRVVTGDPVLTLTGPIDGTKWNSSADNEITWDSEFVADVKIEFSSDNGQTWTDIVESSSANTRSFTWDATNIISTACLMKISDVANPDVFDIIEDPFTLCKLDLLSPNGYAFYRVGSPVEVTWTSEEVGDLTLSYKTSLNGDWVTVDESVPAGNNSYMWTPEEATSWCKIQLKETAYAEVIDESNNNFVVVRLDLTAPSGGENLEWNDEFDITWESEIATSVKIEFSSDNMENWSTVVSNTSSGPGFYSWTIPEVISNQCYVKLSVPGLPDYYSVNATPFSIAEIVDIESLDNNTKFLVSPNPVNDKLFIQIEDYFYQEYSLEIISMNGITTRLPEIYSGSNNLIDLSDLPDGLYLLKIGNNTSYSFQKILKQTH